MTHRSANIITIPEQLEPDHAGIVAWQYTGWPDGAERQFPDPGYAAVYEWAGNLVSAVLEFTDADTGEPSSAYSAHFKAAHGDGLPHNLTKWQAVVALPRTSQEQLADMQQGTHDQWHIAEEHITQYLKSMQAAGELAVGDGALSETFHYLPHLHTVGPSTEVQGRPRVPVNGLWVPGKPAHS